MARRKAGGPPEPFSGDEEALIRRLCRRSFAGGGLSPEENKKMEGFWRRNPEEYNRITEEVREHERNIIRGT